MEHIIADSFQLTVVAMLLVFIVLFGLMVLMIVIGKLIGKEEVISNNDVLSESIKADIEIDEELSNVAILTALAVASNEDSNKHFRVEKIKRVR